MNWSTSQGQLGRLVFDHFGAEPVAFGIMGEGAFILAAIVPSAAKGHVQRDDVQDVDRDVDHLFHDAHVVVGQDLRLDVGQRPPGFAAFRVAFDDVAKGGDRLVGSSGEAQAMPVSDPVLNVSPAGPR